MPLSKTQRVSSFLLAFMFLLTTIGTAVYVIITIRQGDGGIATNSSTNTPQLQKNIKAQVNPLVNTTIENFKKPIKIPVLKYKDEVVGSGAVVQPGDTVTIQYTGALASNGKIFDSSRGVNSKPITFPLSSLIQGWQKGIPGMKVGGKRRLYVPAADGYGSVGAGQAIPPNSDLIFDIDLVNTTRSK